MNRKGVTTQESVLGVINGWFAESNEPPSLISLAQRHNPIVSKIAIHRRVKQLAKAGVINIQNGRPVIVSRET